MLELTPAQISENPFDLLDKTWALLTVRAKGRTNTMTVSWGGLGVLWNKNVATIYVRPQRYTFELLKEADSFTLSFLGEEYREALRFCGTASGRDTDKFSKTGLTAEGEVPYIAQAELVLECRLLYAQDFDSACFKDTTLDSAMYAEKDYHRMYIGEITKVKKQDRK